MVIFFRVILRNEVGHGERLDLENVRDDFLLKSYEKGELEELRVLLCLSK